LNSPPFKVGCAKCIPHLERWGNYKSTHVNPTLKGGEIIIQPMSKKKFVLRLDDEVYEALEQWAADEFRSANGQIEWILTHQLKLNGRYKPKHPGLKDRRTDAPKSEDS